MKLLYACIVSQLYAGSIALIVIGLSLHTGIHRVGTEVNVGLTSLGFAFLGLAMWLLMPPLPLHWILYWKRCATWSIIIGTFLMVVRFVASYSS